jgi:hypothetical protein
VLTGAESGDYFISGPAGLDLGWALFICVSIGFGMTDIPAAAVVREEHCPRRSSPADRQLTQQNPCPLSTKSNNTAKVDKPTYIHRNKYIDMYVVYYKYIIIMNSNIIYFCTSLTMLKYYFKSI